MWQRLHAQAGEHGAVVAVAVDTQGPDAVVPWLDRADADFPCLVDSAGHVPAALGIDVVRTFVPLSAAGRAVRAPVKVHAEDPETFEAIKRWLQTGSVDALAPLDRAETPHSSGATGQAVAQSRAWMELAGVQLGEGRRGAAEASLRRAVAVDPDNPMAQRQLWALTNPERFYDGDIDKEWQRQQLRTPQRAPRADARDGEG